MSTTACRAATAKPEKLPDVLRVCQRACWDAKPGETAGVRTRHRLFTVCASHFLLSESDFSSGLKVPQQRCVS